MSAPKFCILLLILAQMATAVTQATALDSQNEAALAVSTAEEVMASAYQAVKVAETAGADISGFSGLLKDAAELLAQAHNSFRVGDFDSAVWFANLASEIGREVEVTAYQLRESKHDFPAWQMYLAIVESLFAVLAVALTCFFCWRVFKRRYYKRVLKMKPEVGSDGS